MDKLVSMPAGENLKSWTNEKQLWNQTTEMHCYALRARATYLDPSNLDPSNLVPSPGRDLSHLVPSNWPMRLLDSKELCSNI